MSFLKHFSGLIFLSSALVNTVDGSSLNKKLSDMNRNFDFDKQQYHSVDLVNASDSASDLDGSWTASKSYVGQDWFDIASSSNGKNLIAIGTNQLLQSTNYGVKWVINSAPKALNYWAVASSSTGQILYAVVSQGPLFRSHDFGVTWVNASTAFPELPASTGWYDVACSADGTYVTAVDLGGFTWFSKDNGTTWDRSMFADTKGSNIHSTTQAAFFSASMSSNGQYQLVTSGASGGGTTQVYGKIYFSSDYGITFDPSTINGVDIYSVPTQWTSSVMDGDGSICLVGNVRIGGGLFYSYDHGSNFAIMMTVPNVTGIGNLAISKNGEFQAFSAYGSESNTYNGQIYMATDYGSQWNKSDAADGQNMGWQGIAMSASGDFLAAAAYGASTYTYQEPKV